MECPLIEATNPCIMTWDMLTYVLVLRKSVASMYTSIVHTLVEVLSYAAYALSHQNSPPSSRHVGQFLKSSVVNLLSTRTL